MWACAYEEACSASLEEVDAVAGLEGDDGALGVGPGAVAEVAPVALALPLAVQGVHLGHLHPEDVLDRLSDLDAVGAGMDDEGVHAGLHEGVGLLAHDRLDDHVARVIHRMPAPRAAPARRPRLGLPVLARPRRP